MAYKYTLFLFLVAVLLFAPLAMHRAAGETPRVAEVQQMEALRKEMQELRAQVSTRQQKVAALEFSLQPRFQPVQ